MLCHGQPVGGPSHDGKREVCRLPQRALLLRVIYEKNIAIARDQNPLTRLPGNTLIAEFLENLLEDAAAAYVIAYFDFDDFKPFNDKYGFATETGPSCSFPTSSRMLLQRTGSLSVISGETTSFADSRSAIWTTLPSRRRSGA